MTLITQIDRLTKIAKVTEQTVLANVTGAESFPPKQDIYEKAGVQRPGNRVADLGQYILDVNVAGTIGVVLVGKDLVVAAVTGKALTQRGKPSVPSEDEVDIWKP
ncbi:hypothetical protein HYV64_01620 [Candidatus Shapirobacteria bacterium]|nr:hypothetical protein [Candidatus Shapirobacteria bacterium]